MQTANVRVSEWRAIFQDLYKWNLGKGTKNANEEAGIFEDGHSGWCDNGDAGRVDTDT